ncbi:hypothetical protein CLONEX_00192 [[Clostridium] nexile DSM 1787]|nr:hypothetical protein CLONEX_00192 [[Clostridium] nexile DSM 1787]
MKISRCRFGQIFKKEKQRNSIDRRKKTILCFFVEKCRKI